ncbi:hypothetical protein [Rhizobium leguminosarum]|uniref:spike base protein, RCAP_Rcc01079 family n=1 Tax=Rhizobium leguminosarum TaxID=384 RepID=UPI001C9090E2|nr:hypothetical protein [Rhizobium leguminosarum]MBY2936949.1 hypothetical protein [Rhizobium leguminosarum]MBY2966978.1 hypothetical protein [Rhizobium leguminosarum]
MDPSIAPASRAAVVTPNDTAIVGARALYIGTAGDVAIAPRRDMDPVIFKSVPAGTILPVTKREQEVDNGFRVLQDYKGLEEFTPLIRQAGMTHAGSAFRGADLLCL